jgi:hypothetical protein
VHLEELLESVSSVEGSSYGLLTTELTTTEAEAAAEKIDEEIHKVQYKLDHCRRLLQGSETGQMHMHTLTDDVKSQMHTNLKTLKSTVCHLIEHLKMSTSFDPLTLTEIHSHMDEMESNLELLHKAVEHSAFKWRRSRPFPVPVLGERIPMKLFLPVLLDSFVV